MFARKPKEPTTEEAPDSIAPWQMLEEEEIAIWTGKVQERDPLRHLIPFARRLDQDTLACFDKGSDGNGKTVVVLRHFDEPGKGKESRYPGFGGWFDEALRLSQSARTQS